MPSTYTGKGSAQFDEPTTLVWQRPIEVEPETAFRVRLKIAHTAGLAATFAAGFLCYDANGAMIAEKLTLTGSVSTDAWNVFEHDFKDWPAGTVSIRKVFHHKTLDSTIEVDEFNHSDLTAISETAKINADLDQNYWTATTTDSAIAQATLDMKAQIEDPLGTSLGATLENNYRTEVDTDTAIATADTKLKATIEDPNGTSVGASLETEKTTRANADNALATDITSLSARVDTNAGSITDIKALNISSTTSFGTLLTELAVNANGNSAKATEWNAAKADIDGFAAAHTGITVETTGGFIAGIKATSFTNPDGTGGSLMELLGDNVVAEGSLTVKSLTVADVDGNKVPNGNMLNSNAQGWALPATFSVVAGVAGSPAPFNVKMITDVNDQYMWVGESFSLQAGDEYTMSFAHRAAGTTPNVSLRMYVYYYDQAGTYINLDYVDVLNYASTAWATAQATRTAPAGTAQARVRFLRFGGGAGEAYATHFRVIKKHAAAVLITPESITAPLLKVGVLAVQGMAAFGGDLKSDNYVAGSAGWMISASGAAEFQAADITGLLSASQIKIDGITLDSDGNGNLTIKTGGVDTTRILAGAVSEIYSVSNGSITIECNEGDIILGTGTVSWVNTGATDTVGTGSITGFGGNVQVTEHERYAGVSGWTVAVQGSNTVGTSQNSYASVSAKFARIKR